MLYLNGILGFFNLVFVFVYEYFEVCVGLGGRLVILFGCYLEGCCGV